MEREHGVIIALRTLEGDGRVWASGEEKGAAMYWVVF